MKSLNKVQIIGNLTRDPELRTTPNGQPVATIGVATNRSWNDASGEKREEVEYHDVVVWGKLAEICQQILAKGRKVYFEGRMQTRNWEAPDGGGKRYKTEIVAQDMIVLDSRGAGGGGASYSAGEGVQAHPDEAPAAAPAGQSAGAEKPPAPSEDEISIDDIPF
jgi:single-strand DNA-binding protein